MSLIIRNVAYHLNDTHESSSLFFDLHLSHEIFVCVIIQTTVEGHLALHLLQRKVTLHKVSLHLSLIGCWVEYHWFLFYPWPYVLTQNVRDVHHPFFQYLLTIVPCHHSHRRPVYSKTHLQQLHNSLNDCKFTFEKDEGEKKKRQCFCWKYQSWMLILFFLHFMLQYSAKFGE